MGHRPTQDTMNDLLMNFTTRKEHDDLWDQLKTQYTTLSKFQQFEAEMEEKITDADEFLVHNYYNKGAVEGLVKSIQEVASMEFTTKGAFITYQQEIIGRFGDIESNFRKADAKLREG